MTIYGLQFDSIQPLPFTPALQAHYVNGPVSKWPGTVTYKPGWVWIDVLGAAPSAAFWLDVETGDATPGQVPGWLDAKVKAIGQHGGVYCNESSLRAVLDAAGSRQFSLWLATLDGSIPTAASLNLPSTVTLCAVQAFPQSMVGSLAVDVSVVVDKAYWGRAA